MGEAIQIRENYAWYKRLSEDWFATVVAMVER